MMYFNDLKNERSRFTVVWNFLLDQLQPEEAILLSLLIGIESIPTVKRIPTDRTYFEARLYALKSWDEETLDYTLQSLKKQNLIDYKVARDNTGVQVLAVKLITAEIDKLKNDFLEKLELQFVS